MSGKRINCNDFKNRHNISIERFNFNGIRITNDLNKTVKCFAKVIKRTERSDRKIHYLPEIELNIEEDNYFPNEIAVKVECDIKEGFDYRKRK